MRLLIWIVYIYIYVYTHLCKIFGGHYDLHQHMYVDLCRVNQESYQRLRKRDRPTKWTSRPTPKNLSNLWKLSKQDPSNPENWPKHVSNPPNSALTRNKRNQFSVLLKIVCPPFFDSTSCFPMTPEIFRAIPSYQPWGKTAPVDSEDHSH